MKKGGNWDVVVILVFTLGFSVYLMAFIVAQHSTKKAVSTALECTDEYFTAEVDKTVLTGQFRCESGMPCENPEQFERWYAEYEQETSEETAERTNETTAADETEFETCSEGLSEEEDSTKVETDILDSQVPEVVSQSYSYPLYTINGELLSPELQQYLYDRLSENGAEWFFQIALCQIYQESRYDSTAQNPNGLDFGLCQFRKTYFPDMAKESGLYEYDIMSPIDQIWVYAYLMGKYLSMTEGDIPMALSLYYSGEGGQFSIEYVQDVLQWSKTMMEVNNG